MRRLAISVVALIAAIVANAQPMKSQSTVPTRLDAAPALSLSTNPYDASKPVRGDLVPRQLLGKTFTAQPDNKWFSADQIVVKFHEGSAIRLRDGIWVLSSQRHIKPNHKTLSERKLNPDSLTLAVGEANSIVVESRGAKIERLFSSRAEEDLAQLKTKAETASGRELADLNLFYLVLLPKPNIEEAKKIIAALEKLPIVEEVYPQPFSVIMNDIPPTTTINLRLSQGYFSAAPTGIDVDFARGFNGGVGEYAGIVDVEHGWTLDHEDLPGAWTAFSAHGLISSDADHAVHGTAVAGILWAQQNSYGIDGIAPLSELGWSALQGANGRNIVPGRAILDALPDMQPGDVILLETSPHNPTSLRVECPADCDSQCGAVPTEVIYADFIGIQYATALGITVIEAAGNGNVNLDDPVMKTFFTGRDSGAIMVGATAMALTGVEGPACFTNHGSRVDVHAWGDRVATLGFGNSTCKVTDPWEPGFAANGPDVLQQYNACFSGTSSASAIVAGAAALMQSIRAGHSLPKLTSQAMRTLLATTGTPQNIGLNRPIGPLPDLRGAIRATLADSALGKSLSLPAQSSPGAPITGQVEFIDDGPFDWTWTDYFITCGWTSGSPNISVSALASGASHGGTTHSSWITAVPNAPGAYTMRCDMISPLTNASIGSIQKTTLAYGPNQLDASFSNFTWPATVRYQAGRTIPVTQVSVDVRNTGSQDWDSSMGIQVLRSGNMFLSGQGSPLTLSSTLPSGGTKTINMSFVCPGSGNHTVTLRMAVATTAGTTAFGHPISKTVNCTHP